MKTAKIGNPAKRIFVALISCGALWCGLPTYVSAQSTASNSPSNPPPSLADDVNSLTKLLGDLSKDPAALTKSVNDLAKALAKVTAPPTPTDELDTALQGLTKQLITARCMTGDFSKVLDCNAKLLKELAVDVNANLTGKNVIPITTDQQQAIWDALDVLLSLQVKDESNADSDDAITKGIDYTNKKLAPNGNLDLSKLQDSSSVIKAIQTLLTKYITAASLTSLAKNKDVRGSATSIAATLLPLVDPPKADPRINVLGAWYGNIRTIRRAPLAWTFWSDVAADALSAADDAATAAKNAVTADQAAADAARAAQDAAEDAAKSLKGNEIASLNAPNEALVKAAKDKAKVAKDLAQAAKDKAKAAKDAADAALKRINEAKRRISADKSKIGRDRETGGIIALAEAAAAAAEKALSLAQEAAQAATDAAASVADKDAQAPDKIKLADQKLDAARTALDAPHKILDSAVAEASKTTQRIVERTAWLNGSEFCPATRAVRTRCQEQTQCFASNAPPANPPASGAGGTTGEVTGGSMCGYDPVVSTTDTSDKALVVRYECVSESADVWKDIGAAQNPQVKDPRQSRLAVLRQSVIGEIRCQGQSQ